MPSIRISFTDQRLYEERFGELEHVVGVAGLRSLAVLDQATEVRRSIEVFRDTVAAKGDAAVLDHGIPEESDTEILLLVAGQRGNLLQADDPLALRVRVAAGQFVLAVRAFP